MELDSGTADRPGPGTPVAVAAGRLSDYALVSGGLVPLLLMLLAGCAADRVTIGEEQLEPGRSASGTCAGFTLGFAYGRQIRVEGTTQARFDAAELDIFLIEDGFETPIVDVDGWGRCAGGGWEPGTFKLDFSGMAGAREVDVQAHGDLYCTNC